VQPQGADSRRIIARLKASKIDISLCITHRVTFAEAIHQFTIRLDTAEPFYQGRDFGNSCYAAEKSAFDLTSRFSLKKTEAESLPETRDHSSRRS
jgi:hypothetical protein